MFDMGFLELMVVFIIGLLVIGPDKLPGTIKTCAIWINGVRRNIASARAEFERQIGADDIRRDIHNHQVMESLRQAQQKQEEMRQQMSQGNYTGVNHSVPQSDEDPSNSNTDQTIAPKHAPANHASANVETPDTASEGSAQPAPKHDNPHQN